MKIRPYIFTILASLIMALGVGLGISAIGELNEASRLQKDNVQSRATVSQKWIIPGESRGESHRVRYNFPLDDQKLTFERSVPVALHRVLNTGSQFEVIVSPENPDLHEIFPGQLSGLARSKLTAGLIIFGVGLVLFLLFGGLSMFKRKPIPEAQPVSDV